MITTGMLKRQAWMADNDELEHILENSQRVLRLHDQYENHAYVEEFTTECSVMFVYGTYVLEGETNTKFSLSEIWKPFQEDPLPNNASNFCRQMTNCMKAWNYIQKISGSPLGTEIIKQTHKVMMEHRKDILAGEYIKSSAFSGYSIIVFLHHSCSIIIFLHQLVILKDIWNTQFLGFMKLKRMIQL